MLFSGFIAKDLGNLLGKHYTMEEIFVNRGLLHITENICNNLDPISFCKLSMVSRKLHDFSESMLDIWVKTGLKLDISNDDIGKSFFETIKEQGVEKPFFKIIRKMILSCEKSDGGNPFLTNYRNLENIRFVKMILQNTQIAPYIFDDQHEFDFFLCLFVSQLELFETIVKFYIQLDGEEMIDRLLYYLICSTSNDKSTYKDVIDVIELLAKICLKRHVARDWFPVHEAVKKDMPEVLRILVTMYKSPNARNYDTFLTPMDIAVAKDNHELINILLPYYIHEKETISNIHEFSPIDRTTSLYIALYQWKTYFVEQLSQKFKK